MLSTREAFKFGFLSRCIDENLSPEATELRVKRAADLTNVKSAGVLTKGLVGGGLLLGGAGLAGAGLGGLAAHLTTPEVSDEEAKMQELLLAYRQHANRARLSSKRRSLRQSVRRSPKPPSFSSMM